MTTLKVNAKEDFDAIKDVINHRSEAVRSLAVKVFASGSVNQQMAEVLGYAAPREKQTAIREKIVECLGEAADDGAKQAAFPALLTALQENEKTIQKAALASLRKINIRPPAFERELLKCLKLSNMEVQLYALEALGKMGSEAEPVSEDIQEVANNKKTDKQLRLKAIWAVGKVGRARGCAKTLVNATLDDDWEVAASALESLKEIGRLTDPDVDVLEPLLKRTENKETDKNFRRLAVLTLGKIARTQPSVRTLTQAALDDDPELAKNALQSLKDIAPLQKADIAALKSLIKSKHPEVCHFAVRELRELKKLGAEEAEEALESFTKELLGRLRGKTDFGKLNLPELESLIKDKKVKIDFRRSAVEIVGTIGVKAESVAPALQDLANDRKTDKQLRRQCIWALGEIGVKESITTIIDAPSIAMRTWRKPPWSP